MSLNRAIPNLVTLGNLFCGCLAIMSAFKGNLLWASYLVLVAVLLDFADGFIARILNGASAMGKELDSLADVVSFGVVPAVIMFRMLEIGRLRYFSSLNMDLSAILHLDYVNTILLSVPFLLTFCAAIRLARFNVDGGQRDYFAGLPTPAAALLVASLPIILLKQINVGHVALPYDATVVTFHNIAHLSGPEGRITMYLLDAKVMVTFTAVVSFLMVAPVRLISLKFKNFRWRENAARYIFLGLSLVLILFFYALAAPFVILLYLLISVYHFRWGSGRS